MASATSSLPVPLSPRTSTVLLERATFCTAASSPRIAGSSPTISRGASGRRARTLGRGIDCDAGASSFCDGGSARSDVELGERRPGRVARGTPRARRSAARAATWSRSATALSTWARAVSARPAARWISAEQGVGLDDEVFLAAGARRGQRLERPGRRPRRRRRARGGPRRSRPRRAARRSSPAPGRARAARAPARGRRPRARRASRRSRPRTPSRACPAASLSARARVASRRASTVLPRMSALRAARSEN